MKAPEGYFDDLENRVFAKLQEEGLPDEIGMKVPEDYFDTLEDRLIERLGNEETTQVIPLYRRRPFVYAASIAACLILAVTLFIRNAPDDIVLEIADIEAYFEEGGMEYDTDDIAQLLTDEDLEDLPSEKILFSDQDIEEYLLENLDDTNLLIE